MAFVKPSRRSDVVMVILKNVLTFALVLVLVLVLVLGR